MKQKRKDDDTIGQKNRMPEKLEKEFKIWSAYADNKFSKYLKEWKKLAGPFLAAFSVITRMYISASNHPVMKVILHSAVGSKMKIQIDKAVNMVDG